MVTRSSRLADYIVAAGLAVVALAISPIGIQLATGRANLTFRVNVISLTFVLVLIAVIAAILARGRLRRACFYAIAWVVPLALLAGIEAAALSVRLADRVTPLEDTSLLARKTPWPGHLYSDSSYYWDPGGVILYRPWQGAGISFNALGLRTAMPAPKAPGEWRIAVTGGSEVWGWRVLDADTIPAQLQDVLRRAGHANVTVYNFGIGGASMQMELALLKRFRETYAIDQDILPAALKTNPLRKVIAEADDYCRTAAIRCDFVLQPMLFTRKTRSGPEVGILTTLARVYPRIDVLTTGLFRDALAAGPTSRTYDFAHVYDQTSQPFFLDLIHTNEAGHRAAAEKLAPIVADGVR